MKQITGDMKVSEVIHRHPMTIGVFLGRGCPDMRRGFFKLMGRLMSVRSAARIHKIELGPLLEDLTRLLQRLQRQLTFPETREDACEDWNCRSRGCRELLRRALDTG